jgi:phosphate-selective porin OprO/OprP
MNKGISLLLSVSVFVPLWTVATVRGDELDDLKQKAARLQKKADQAAELAEIKEQIAELQNRIIQLEAKQRVNEKAAGGQKEDQKADKTMPARTDFRVFWKEGLNFATLDENFKLKIGGRIQNDWLWISEDNGTKSDVVGGSALGQQEDGTEFRRARLCVSGLIYGNIEFKAEYDFAGGDADFRDVYIGILDLPIGNIRAGHFKEPFSLEELTSCKYITFLERALPNALVPSRNTGFMLHNAAADERMTTAIGLFRDTDDYGDTQDDGGYNVTGRITSLPIYTAKGACLLHVGAAYSHRKPDDSYSFEASPETHLADDFVATGSIAGDRVELLGLEAAWVNGPFSLQSEYIMADAGRFTGSDVHFDGYYVQASYFLTGEHRNYKTSEAFFDRVKPNQNFSNGGGPGAWEIALRYSELDLNDSNIAGGRLNNVTTGLNWQLNPNTRIMWDYVHADKNDVGNADMLMMRLQVDF